MDLTEKITRDINELKGVSPSPVTQPSPSVGFDFYSLFNYYTIGIVFFIILIFGAWFAWDWYKTNKKYKEVVTSSNQNNTENTLDPVIEEKCKNDQRALETALSTSNDNGEPMANDISQGSGKDGWCYIGEDQGYNVCANVNRNDSCMSGQIYATQEECIQNQ